jgi:hypothetical protein
LGDDSKFVLSVLKMQSCLICLLKGPSWQAFRFEALEKIDNKDLARK